MKRLSSLILTACLSCAGIAGAADQTVVQDGIAVKPLPVWRKLASEQQLEQDAALQYTALLTSASEKKALAPPNHPQLIRLRAIAKRMIPYTARWNPDAAKWDWQVNLLASKQINAFCMPGGRIAFFTGIIDTLNLTDDEIAAVLGPGAAYFGFDPSVADSVAQGAGQLAVLKFSRDDEREADLVGLDLASRAGYDPRAGIALWQKMGALNQVQPFEFMSTHPSDADRISRIEQHMNLLLPLYAHAKGVQVAQLPAYTTTALTK